MTKLENKLKPGFGNSNFEKIRTRVLNEKP
jgi:hypothetical protein